MTVLTIRELDAPYVYVVSEEAIGDVSRLLEVVSKSENSTSVVLSLTERGGRRSILELRGLGKEVWKGIDAKLYIDELRDEWDAR